MSPASSVLALGQNLLAGLSANRPDGYVACAAEADNVGLIADYLGAIDVAKAVAA
jgi:hypothetical protein